MKSLYLRHRPQTIADLDLESVRTTLGKLVASGSIPHSLLFYGPKGTGKTSAARIIAKIVNCENVKNGIPCGKCNQCLSIENGSNIDVIEMDAASNRGIDDIRSLRETLKLAPNSAPKKVYVIDEAHMLTTEASNALLKSMEEPPEHVMFILATTNPEKLIPTIRSRATGVAFIRATESEIANSLGKKLKKEKIKFDQKALLEIAKIADGSFRDADKMLEFALSQKTDLTNAQKVVTVFAKEYPTPKKLLENIFALHSKEAIIELNLLVEQGAQVADICKALLKMVRAELLATIGIEGETSMDVSTDELIRFIKFFSQAGVEITDSFLPQAPLEIAIIEWCQMHGNGGVGKTKEETKENSSKVDSTPKEPVKTDSIDIGGSEAKNGNGVLPKEEVVVTNGSELSSEIWREVLALVKPKNASTEALLRASQPVQFDGKTLTLGVYYRFHKEHLETGSHKRLLEDTLSDVLGENIRVVCTLTEPKEKIVEAIVTNHETSGDSSLATAASTVLQETEDDLAKLAEEIFKA